MEKCECPEESDESEGEADDILIVDQSMPQDYTLDQNDGIFFGICSFLLFSDEPHFLLYIADERAHILQEVSHIFSKNIYISNTSP